MKIFAALFIAAAAACGVSGQQKMLSAQDVVDRIAAGADVKIEDAEIEGDLDLTRLPGTVNDAVYSEKGKTARVFSGMISQKVLFKNVRFTGNVTFFRDPADAAEIREYRVQFNDAAAFVDCVFEKKVNFELTNFNGGVSFAGSVFRQPPLFIRVGWEKSADLTGAVFERKAIYQFTQNNLKKRLDAVELQNLLNKLKGWQ